MADYKTITAVPTGADFAAILAMATPTTITVPVGPPGAPGAGATPEAVLAALNTLMSA